MTRLPGESLTNLWHSLSVGKREESVSQVAVFKELTEWKGDKIAGVELHYFQAVASFLWAACNTLNPSSDFICFQWWLCRFEWNLFGGNCQFCRTYSSRSPQIADRKADLEISEAHKCRSLWMHHFSIRTLIVCEIESSIVIGQCLLNVQIWHMIAR